MSPRTRRPATALLLALLIAPGCHTPHYVVVEDQAPLYGADEGDEVIARLPRYAHADLEDEPDPDARRVRVTHEGRAGWADRSSVRVFEFLHPFLDDGADRDRVIRREVRELQLADLGEGWDDDAVEAIRNERVIVGMTRTQVEVAWGWPVTVEPGPHGGERWIYRESVMKRMRRFADSTSTRTWGASPQPWGADREDVPNYPAWVTVRVPVTIERIVEFDEAGTVTKVKVRRYLDEAGSS